MLKLYFIFFIFLAHRIERHSGGLSKAATKLNRTVDVELNFSRPMSNNQVKKFQPFYAWAFVKRTGKTTEYLLNYFAVVILDSLF
jgi:hypothetical protein